MELKPDTAKTIDKVISAVQGWRGKNSDMEPERVGTIRQKPVVSVCIGCECRCDRSLRGIEQPCWTERLILGTVSEECRWIPGVKAGVKEI